MKASIGRTCMTLPIAIPAIVIRCLAAQTSTDEILPVLALQVAFVRSMIAPGHHLPEILIPRIVGTAHRGCNGHQQRNCEESQHFSLPRTDTYVSPP